MKNKIFFFDEMFDEAFAFEECAEYSKMRSDNSQTAKGIFKSQTPMIVNYAFACEVFLKLLLFYYHVELKQIHKLKDLFDLLPDNVKEIIKEETYKRSGEWNDFWGFPLLNQISDAFVEWRYKYENDFSKSAVKQINLLFLQTFCEVLRDYCLLNVFHISLEKYQKEVR